MNGENQEINNNKENSNFSLPSIQNKLSSSLNKQSTGNLDNSSFNSYSEMSDEETIRNYKKYIDFDDVLIKKHEERENNDDDYFLSEKYVRFLDYKFPSNDIKIITSKSTLIFLIVMISLISILLCVYFGIFIFLNDENNKDCYNFLELTRIFGRRFVYLSESIIFFKIYTLTNGDNYINKYKDSVNLLFENEELYESFRVNSENSFVENIFDLTNNNTSICDYFIKFQNDYNYVYPTNFSDALYNNSTFISYVTLLNKDICNNVDIIQPILRSDIAATTIYIANFLKESFNKFYIESNFEGKVHDYVNINYDKFTIHNNYSLDLIEIEKNIDLNDNISNYVITSDKGELKNLVNFYKRTNFIQVDVIYQFVIKQITYITTTIYSQNFVDLKNKSNTIVIFYTILFVIFTLLIVYTNRYLNYHIISLKQKNNQMLVSIIPYQFIKKLDLFKEKSDNK